MNRRLIRTLVVTLASVLVNHDALAQRGGGGRAGRQAPAGQGGAPSFNRTPSFTAPSQGTRPNTGQAVTRPAGPAAPGPQTRPVASPGGRPSLGNPAHPGGTPRPTPAPMPTPGLRPNPGNNTGTVNRPNINTGDRTNTGTLNRPNINTGNANNTGMINRPNINTGNTNNKAVVNRPNINAGNTNNTAVINRPNINARNTNNNININRPTVTNRQTTNINTNINNVTNVTNVNRNVNVVANNSAAWAARPGAAYHQGWVNGYWNGHNSSNWWGNGGAFVTGMAVGGIGAWGIGSSIYNWGYQPYVNPFYGTGAVVVQQPPIVVQQQPVIVQQQPVVAVAPSYDYSKPLDTSAAPPAEAAADPALQHFEGARAAFKAGDYGTALTATDAALKTLPNDAAMHEFRALVDFAQGQYDQAAATLYAVLSAGPGWDWTTLVGLYPSVDVYTAQLRALEQYRDAHAGSAAAHFVLAYHYLTQGTNDAAINELKEVVRLTPTDQLSAELLRQLSGAATAAVAPASTTAPAPTSTPAGEPTAQPVAATNAAAPIRQGNLVGAWKASPAKDVTIALTVSQDNHFTWTVNQQGKTLPIEGNSTYENGVLTLTQAKGDPLAGTVVWQDDNHFTFQAQGGGPNDQGLAFSK